MKICAVILDYRGATKTETCLLSLVGQGVDTVLVIDNSANANTQLAKSIEYLKEHVDYALHLIDLGVNLGFAKGVNIAFSHQTARHCDAFLLINNDAVILSGSILELINAMETGTASIVAPMIVDDNGILQPMQWYQRFLGLQTDHSLVGSFPYASGCCLLFTRNILEAGKLFDEDFFMYGEDTLLGWKMQEQGKSIMSIQTVIVRHTGQSGLKQCSLFYEYHIFRAHILLALKTRRNHLEIPLLIATKSLVLLLRAFVRSIRYRTGIPLLAFFIGWIPLGIRKS